MTNCHKIGHLIFDSVDLDKTYPHYLILFGWYWNAEEGSTNLQARFYSQQELGSDIHLAQLQGRWKAGLQEQGERRRHSLALTARPGAPWLLLFFSNRGWRLEAFFLGSLSICMILSREHLCEMGPRVHTFPVYVCGSIMMGRLAKSQAAMLAYTVECGNGEQNDYL